MSAKSNNQHIQCENATQLFRLQEEYENYAGRETIVDERNLTLTVLSMPRKYKRKSKKQEQLRRNRRERNVDYLADHDYAEYS